MTDHLDYLPLVRAWVGLGWGGVPSRVEILSRKKKSVIYRLVGVGPNGSDVIVKSCRRETAIVEREIYARVLTQLRVDPIGYYGFVDDAQGEFSWLFLEDVGGEEFQRGNPEHRAAAARWLARLHTGSAGLDLDWLPDRGPGWYLEQMRGARYAIRQNYDNPALFRADREVLDKVLARFDHVESRWGDVERTGAEMPRSLVHCDFAGKNVRVRQNGAGLELFAFDWEFAGWGLPPVDLAYADLDVYGSAVGDVWPLLNPATLPRFVCVGKLLHAGLLASHWSAVSLASERVKQPISDLAVYQFRMGENLRELGWSS